MKLYHSLLLLLFAAGASITPVQAGEGDQAASDHAEVSALVVTAPLRTMELAGSVTAYGRVANAPDGLVTVSLPIAGQVESLQVIPGQHVRRGDLLLRIHPDATGALAYSQAENALAFARGEVERTRTQLEKQLATRAQLAAAERAERDAEQALAAQKAMGNGNRAQRITAPFDGIVSTLTVASGDRFAAGTSLLQLAASHRLQVRLAVAPQASRQIKAGQPAKLVSLSESNQTGGGAVAQVGSQLDPVSGMVDVGVDIGVSDSGGDWLIGDSVRAVIRLDSHQGKAVPRQAVLADADGSYLFQVQGDKAVRVNVTPGVEKDGWLEVSGEMAGAPVVIEGNYELDDGMLVRVK